ncbi:MAG: tol-pal system protein YbgF [bacterium]
MKYRNFGKTLAGIGLVAGTVFFGLAPAFAGRGDDVAQLKQQVDALVATNQKNYQDVAQAMNAMTEIQQEFRAIKGQLDSSQYVMKESDRVYQDLDQRVSALEDKIGQMHNLLKDINMKLNAPEGAKPPAPAASQAEVQEFQSLLNVANARDYRNAASGFLGFLKKYPNSEYAGNAQYWVGESFYSLGDYAKAISEFQVLAQKYPMHPRVKEGIYKQGMAFMKLNKRAEAKLFFQKVVATYPNSAEAYQAKGRLMRLEELEKSSPTLALSQNPKENPPPPPPPATGEPVYRPIMKPNPMPRGPVPPSPTAAPTTPSNPNAPGTPASPQKSAPPPSAPEPAGQGSGAPLF